MRSKSEGMDPVVSAVLAGLATSRERFSSALRAAIEQVRALIDDQRVAGADRAGAVAQELGHFAAARIDSSRLSALLHDNGPKLDAAGLASVEEAYAVLSEIAEQADALFVLDLEAGDDLGEAVVNKLATVGRAFAAARAVAAARAGRHPGSVQAELHPRRWNLSERGLAPPLVVRLPGDALRVSALGDLLDGRQKVVLVATPPMPAAPLARLITPRTFVAQVGDASALADFSSWDGPGVAAIVGDGAAWFRHDPRAGATFAERIVIDRLPAGEPPLVGGVSYSQQEDELSHLRALAEAGAPTPVEASSTPTSEPVSTRPTAPAAVDPLDRMASWLLQQSNLEGLT